MRPSYDFYSTNHAGKLALADFTAALPLACAKLEAMTGEVDSTSVWADRWMHAACALVDRVAGLDVAGTVASETVGSTSVTYAAGTQMSREQGDLAAVLPWLTGTGLLCSAVM